MELLFKLFCFLGNFALYTKAHKTKPYRFDTEGRGCHCFLQAMQPEYGKS